MFSQGEQLADAYERQRRRTEMLQSCFFDAIEKKDTMDRKEN